MLHSAKPRQTISRPEQRLPVCPAGLVSSALLRLGPRLKADLMNTQRVCGVRGVLCVLKFL